MSDLCEIKSIAIYRNTNNNAIYLTLKKVGSTVSFSGKILIKSTLPTCLLDQYIHVKLDGNPVGKHLLKEKIGKDIVTVEIDRYNIAELTNYEKTQKYLDTNIQCDYTMQN